MNTSASLATDGSRHGYASDLHVLRSEFSEWGVWRSGTGRWWAFRTGRNPLTLDQLRAGCRLIVQADTLNDLRGMMQTETVTAQQAVAG